MPRPPRPLLMALLADVKQNPDDLTPWLVLCDWLEEQDDEADRARGEYCRLCFDKLGTKTYASDWEKGERRRHLYRTYHEAWLGPISPLRHEITKGLWIVTCDKIAAHVESLKADLEACAWIGTLSIGTFTLKMMSNRGGVGWLVEGLHTLHLYADLDDRRVATLAAWSALRELRALTLRLPALTLYQAQSLIESPNLTKLEMLTIEHRRYNRTLRIAHESLDIQNKLEEAFGERLVLIDRG